MTTGRRVTLPLAVSGSDLLAGLRPALSSWLGEAHWPGWIERVGAVPRCNRMFLEIHPASSPARCDIVTSLSLSDGSLSAWLAAGFEHRSPVWAATIALLRDWRCELATGQGGLRDQCMMMWLEFDLVPNDPALGNPALFIALVPGANIQALSASLAGYPTLADEVCRFAALIRDHDVWQRSDDLVLGHIGLMASRPSGASGSSLRSCWRCDSEAQLLQRLSLLGIADDGTVLHAEMARLRPLLHRGNSLMLDCDSADRFFGAFAVEVNVFQRQLAPAVAGCDAVLQAVVELGFLTPDQKRQLQRINGRFLTGSGRSVYCLLHHIKFRFVDTRIVEAKLYWLVRVINTRARWHDTRVFDHADEAALPWQVDLMDERVPSERVID